MKHNMKLSAHTILYIYKYTSPYLQLFISFSVHLFVYLIFIYIFTINLFKDFALFAYQVVYLHV